MARLLLLSINRDPAVEAAFLGTVEAFPEAGMGEFDGVTVAGGFDGITFGGTRLLLLSMSRDPADASLGATEPGVAVFSAARRVLLVPLDREPADLTSAANDSNAFQTSSATGGAGFDSGFAV